MTASTSALPFGDDGYESFVGKGSCRKCGQIAFGKRKCQRCYRKFCSTCAPTSLQKYGEEAWEECCIGCEPYLVVAPADAEPIFELEPESEDVLSIAPGQQGPIHVPLSETCTDDLSNPRCSPKSCSTISTYSESNSEEEESTSQSLSIQSECQQCTAKPRDCRSCRVQLCSASSIQHQQDLHGMCRSCSSKEEEVLKTPTKTREICSANLHHFALEPPITPNSGCCTACQQYSTGKRPCQTCGTKYCHDANCQAYLHKDGSCTKCRPTPNESIQPICHRQNVA